MYVCPNCQLEFKNINEASRISIIYPGGGYFYTGHPFMGISDAFIELYLILIVFFTLVDILNGIEGAFESFVFFSIILVLEKIISIYHSSNFIKEYIPKEKEIEPLNKENL